MEKKKWLISKRGDIKNEIKWLFVKNLVQCIMPDNLEYEETVK